MKLELFVDIQVEFIGIFIFSQAINIKQIDEFDFCLLRLNKKVFEGSNILLEL